MSPESRFSRFEYEPDDDEEEEKNPWDIETPIFSTEVDTPEEKPSIYLPEPTNDDPPRSRFAGLEYEPDEPLLPDPASQRIQSIQPPVAPEPEEESFFDHPIDNTIDFVKDHFSTGDESYQPTPEQMESVRGYMTFGEAASYFQKNPKAIGPPAAPQLDEDYRHPPVWASEVLPEWSTLVSYEKEGKASKTQIAEGKKSLRAAIEGQIEREVTDDELDLVWAGAPLVAEKGFQHKVNDWLRNPSSSIPFVGGAVELAELAHLADAAYKFEKDEATDEEVVRLQQWVENNAAETTLAGAVFEQIVAAPAFMGELLATAGIYTGVRKGTEKVAFGALEKFLTKKTAREILRKSAGKRTAEWAAAKVASAGVASAAQAIPARGLQMVGGVIENMMPHLQLSPEAQGIVMSKDQSDRDLMSSVYKAMGDEMIEVASEKTGGAFKAMGKKAGNWFAKNATIEAFLKAGGDLKQFRPMLNKMGWDGILEEMFEERVGAGMRAVAGIGEWEEIIPTWKQAATELLSFGAIGGAFTLAGAGVRQAEKYALMQEQNADRNKNLNAMSEETRQALFGMSDVKEIEKILDGEYKKGEKRRKEIEKTLDDEYKKGAKRRKEFEKAHKEALKDSPQREKDAAKTGDTEDTEELVGEAFDLQKELGRYRYEMREQGEVEDEVFVVESALDRLAKDREKGMPEDEAVERAVSFVTGNTERLGAEQSGALRAAITNSTPEEVIAFLTATDGAIEDPAVEQPDTIEEVAEKPKVDEGEIEKVDITDDQLATLMDDPAIQRAKESRAKEIEKAKNAHEKTLEKKGKKLNDSIAFESYRLRDLLADYGGVYFTGAQGISNDELYEQFDQKQRASLSRQGVIAPVNFMQELKEKGTGLDGIHFIPADEVVEMLKVDWPQLGIETSDDLFQAVKSWDRLNTEIFNPEAEQERNKAEQQAFEDSRDTGEDAPDIDSDEGSGAYLPPIDEDELDDGDGGFDYPSKEFDDEIRATGASDTEGDLSDEDVENDVEDVGDFFDQKKEEREYVRSTPAKGTAERDELDAEWQRAHDDEKDLREKHQFAVSESNAKKGATNESRNRGKEAAKTLGERVDRAKKTYDGAEKIRQIAMLEDVIEDREEAHRISARAKLDQMASGGTIDKVTRARTRRRIADAVDSAVVERLPDLPDVLIGQIKDRVVKNIEGFPWVEKTVEQWIDVAINANKDVAALARVPEVLKGMTGLTDAQRQEIEKEAKLGNVERVTELIVQHTPEPEDGGQGELAIPPDQTAPTVSQLQEIEGKIAAMTDLSEYDAISMQIEEALDDGHINGIQEQRLSDQLADKYVQIEGTPEEVLPQGEAAPAYDGPDADTIAMRLEEAYVELGQAESAEDQEVIQEEIAALNAQLDTANAASSATPSSAAAVDRRLFDDEYDGPDADTIAMRLEEAYVELGQAESAEDQEVIQEEIAALNAQLDTANAASSATPSSAAAVDRRLFDDEYDGPRFTYGLQNRPLDSFHVPDGWIIGSDRQSDTFTHGTVQYPRALSLDEMEAFELSPAGSPLRLPPQALMSGYDYHVFSELTFGDDEIVSSMPRELLAPGGFHGRKSDRVAARNRGRGWI
jgi:hypothetical protein